MQQFEGEIKIVGLSCRGSSAEHVQCGDISVRSSPCSSAISLQHVLASQSVYKKNNYKMYANHFDTNLKLTVHALICPALEPWKPEEEIT